MDVNVLKVAGQIAGIGGLAIGIFLILSRHVVNKDLYERITGEHSFKLFRLIIILSWCLGIAGIMAWAYAGSHSMPSISSSTTKPNEMEYEGYVKNSMTRKPVKDAEVELLPRSEIGKQITDSEGHFIFRLKTPQDKVQVMTLVKHKDYQEWTRSHIITGSYPVDYIFLEPDKPSDSATLPKPQLTPIPKGTPFAPSQPPSLPYIQYQYSFTDKDNTYQGYYIRQKGSNAWDEIHPDPNEPSRTVNWHFIGFNGEPGWITIYDSSRNYYIRFREGERETWAQLATSSNGPWGNLHFVTKLK